MKHASAVIRTGRLHLARLCEDDAGLMLAVWNDPAFLRFVGDRGVRTLDDALEAMREGALKQWDEHGHGPYRVSPAGGGEAMGICGLFKRENLDQPDIGYGFLPEFCGNGYAFEAASAVLAHARDHMALPGIKAIVSPENVRSVHLLEKLGLSREGTIRMPGEDEDILLFGIPF